MTFWNLVTIILGGTLWGEFWIHLRDEARKQHIDQMLQQDGVDLDEADKPRGGTGDL